MKRPGKLEAFGCSVVRISSHEKSCSGWEKGSFGSGHSTFEHLIISPFNILVPTRLCTSSDPIVISGGSSGRATSAMARLGLKN
ncbi:Hypothetical protein NTJ_12925 [Nesidiocoris tenuis]|uniref:Uncharacterized protein n=1 Tax=Nesidiocoris tenuis TaxID=355587 RepID=A0ABN7B6U0_9HEMI|nr:Hypothetical protein NTJ_12925 [Nesidiocoris tenuis]